MNRVKRCLQTLLDHFINQEDKPNIGVLDFSRGVNHEFSCSADMIDIRQTISLTAPFSGFVIFYCKLDVTDCSIRKEGFGDFARNGIRNDTSTGRWQTINTPIVKGESIIFDYWGKEEGNGVIQFIPYKNT